MTNSVLTIPLNSLALSFIPVLIVVCVLFKWSLNYRSALYGISKMLVQLMLVGYFLTYIFEAKNAWIIFAVLSVMVLVSSWIALRSVKIKRRILYGKTLISISLGGGVILLLITQGVLDLQPWFLPQYMVPLAGMIFANALNSISLAAERLEAELERNVPHLQAGGIAFQASLIPITNSLFAVGLVSLPGMMTGQILSGVSPLIAARYQIMVMCMIYSAAGISSASFLYLVKPVLFGLDDTKNRECV